MQTAANYLDQIPHVLGPLAIVALRFAAALLAFVPSSPLSLAAGASYGLLSGTAFVLIGAEMGALAAFLVGRRFGSRFVARRGWLERVARTRPGSWLLEGDASQGRLMLAVLYCRLLPGFNLDGLSYVAGLTPIATWRFCLATFLGLLPYTLFLVGTGELIKKGFPDRRLGAALALVLVATAIPLCWKVIRGWLRPRNPVIAREEAASA
jgi:uncharacterized membrane protein YdjX (TVP38/TMEM64 family)